MLHKTLGVLSNLERDAAIVSARTAARTSFLRDFRAAPAAVQLSTTQEAHQRKHCLALDGILLVVQGEDNLCGVLK